MEALGVVWASKHFRAYLFGHVYRDHSPLRAMLSSPHPSGKLARWGQVLAELDPSGVARGLCCEELV